MRTFNTAGPVKSEDHYHIPPLSRFDLDKILELIEDEKYFILHAPRQVGKTSYLLALMDYLNERGGARCLYINVEGAQASREDVENAMQAILTELLIRTEIHLQDGFFKENFQELGEINPFALLNFALTQWCLASPLPVILFIDEVDALIGDTLIAVLRQLRSGYDRRPASFPQSIVLCGVRDVRDYRIYSSREKEVITGGSAFNIKTESLRMEDFTEQEVYQLYAQHTAETGQSFEADALSTVWELTQGQPWLVNALGNEVCFEMAVNRDRSQTITHEMILKAKEALILRRDTHLDQLDRQMELARVQRVISPMLQGITTDQSLKEDDLQYVIDLGLVRRTEYGPQIANPIYLEVIPRQLTSVIQSNLKSVVKPSWYLLSDGRLDMDKLMAGFQQFFRENSESWLESYQYKEAGPQLLLQAYLQRVVNGGGSINREYGLGRGRTDLYITWPLPNGKIQREVIELKIRYGDLEKTIEKGLKQTWQYMDRCGAPRGQLVIFDRSKKKNWKEKIFRRTEFYEKCPITVWGM